MDETFTPPDGVPQQPITPEPQHVPPPPMQPPEPPQPVQAYVPPPHVQPYEPPPVQPPEPPPLKPADTEDTHGGRRIAAIILILLGLLFYAQQFLPALGWATLWPAILIVVGVYILLRGRRS